MKTRNILRGIKKSATIGVSLLSLAGCADRGDLLFDGEIEGQRVRYFDGGYFTFVGSSDILEVYSKEDKEKLSKLFLDWDQNGIVGDQKVDRYEVYDQDGRKIIYQSYRVIDRNGIEYGSEDEISKKALEVSKTRLEEATKEYQVFKQKIEERVKQEL